MEVGGQHGGETRCNDRCEWELWRARVSVSVLLTAVSPEARIVPGSQEALSVCCWMSDDRARVWLWGQRAGTEARDSGYRSSGGRAGSPFLQF